MSQVLLGGPDPWPFDLQTDLLATVDSVPEGQRATAADTGLTYQWLLGGWKIKGSKVYLVAADPASDLGDSGDVAINVVTGDVWAKEAGTWINEGTIHPVIPAPSWLFGSGAPASSLGLTGNFYDDPATNRVWQKTSTTSVIAETLKVNDSGDASSGSLVGATTLTPTVNRGYLAYVFTSGGSYFHAPACTALAGGGGLTWVLQETIGLAGPTGTPGQGIQVFRAMKPSGLTSGVLTATVNGYTDYARIVVLELTGMDTSGTDGSGMIVQGATAVQTPFAGNTSVSVALAAFGDPVNNAVFAGFSHLANEATTPEAGYTEITDNALSSPRSFGWQTEWKLGEDLTPSASWTTSTKGCGAAVEIKANVTVESWVERGAIGVQFSRTVILNGTTTYTTPSYTRTLDITAIAGGGAGGSANSGTGAGGTGGAAGGMGKKIIQTPAASYTVAVGAGGTGAAAGAGNPGGNTTWATTTIIATGGAGGLRSTTAGTKLGGAPTAVGSGGDINLPGAAGGFSNSLVGGETNPVLMSGRGADSPLGAGGASLSDANATGNAGIGYGAGGGGAYDKAATNRAGGAGANGVIFVDEYR